MTFGRSFLPGPADVHPEVLAATTGPILAHRTPAMRALLDKMQPDLQRMFGTAQPVFISTSSASGLMEAAIRSGVPRRVLVVVGGYFGERFARVAEACGKEVIRAHVPQGRTLEPDQLDAFLEGPDVDAVALVHSETSTGALCPLRELAEVVHRHEDVHLLVDGVTAIGSSRVETDGWGLDFVFTGSQKALALPPGIALGTASPRFVARALTTTDRGWYLSVPNLVRVAQDGVPEYTPASPLYYALSCQLRRIADAGGFEARWARHAAMLAMMEEWTARTPGISLLAPAGRRSPAVSALDLPPTLDPARVIAGVGALGFSIGAGLEPLTHRVVRVGHMGDLTPEHLDDLLRALSPVVHRSP